MEVNVIWPQTSTFITKFIFLVSLCVLILNKCESVVDMIVFFIYLILYVDLLISEGGGSTSVIFKWYLNILNIKIYLLFNICYKFNILLFFFNVINVKTREKRKKIHQQQKLKLGKEKNK